MTDAPPEHPTPSTSVSPADPPAADADLTLGRRLRRNPVLLCVHHALMMSLFPMAVLTLFQHDHLGLSIAEIMTVQAAFGGALALFEFPSGYMADRIGYRPTMILASLVSIAGWSVYCVASGFWTVVGAEILMGLGISLVSGTHSALLYESLANRNREEDFARWYARSRTWAQIAEGSAALIAGLIFALSVRLPFYLMVIVWIVNLGVSIALVEPRYARRTAQRPIEHMRSLIRYVAHGAPRLRALFGVSVVIGLSNFMPVWLVQLYARDGGVPVTWLGPIWAIANYTVALGSMMSGTLARRIGIGGVLLSCCFLIGLGYFGMGLSYAWWGFVFYFAFNLSRGISSPLLAHEEQKAIPSGDRASLVSLRSLLFRAGFILLGPLSGVLIDLHGQHMVLLGLGALMFTLALASSTYLARAPSAQASDHGTVVI
jgi:MFS family permease